MAVSCGTTPGFRDDVCAAVVDDLYKYIIIT